MREEDKPLTNKDAFFIGAVFAAILTGVVLVSVFMLFGSFKTNCDQHIIDAATEQIDEHLRAELVLCDYEGPLLP